MSKYEYLWIVQGFYGKWEDLTFCENWREGKQSIKDYIDNQKKPVRLIQRRILKQNGD